MALNRIRNWLWSFGRPYEVYQWADTPPYGLHEVYTYRAFAKWGARRREAKCKAETGHADTAYKGSRIKG